MSDNIRKKVWLIGPGLMGIEYAKVLRALNIDFEVIGRSEKSAKKFTEITSVNVHKGGLQEFLTSKPDLPTNAIVAVNVEALAETTLLLLKYGIKNILVEKPAGLNLEEITLLAQETLKQKAEVYVAYNRRFYAATLEAEKIIKEDGGVTSFIFEFTEWSHQIVNLDKDPRVKQEWFLANSTHVVDLAFHLGGYPIELNCYTAGKLSWHPIASIFTGSGKTDKKALFSYHANWAAPGRWSVEILTNKHRLIFRPMEKLQIQKIGSVAIEEVPIDYTLDTNFKHGFYRQVEAFLMGKDKEKLESIISHQKMTKEIYSKIVRP